MQNLNRVKCYLVLFSLLSVCAYASGMPEDALDESKVGVAAKFITIKAGTFTMGSPPSEYGRYETEIQHKVTLTKDFQIQATEVTQLQYFLVMGKNPSQFDREIFCKNSDYIQLSGVKLCAHHPVENLSWEDAQKFIRRLNEIQKKYTFSLPSEAQWEYASRAGKSSKYPYWFGKYDDIKLRKHSWFMYSFFAMECLNPPDGIDFCWHSQIVATKAANPLGIFDMYGNVSEWVQDYYATYPKEAVIDPMGPAIGEDRVVRGGHSNSYQAELRSANRMHSAGTPNSDIGFRLVRTGRNR